MNTTKQILLIFIAIFAISLTAFFSVGLFVAHKLAVSTNLSNNETVKIVLSTDEFFALKKTTLNKNVFEIEYHGEEYDVYKTENSLSKSQITLWTKKDSFENEIRKLNSIVLNTNALSNKINTNKFLLFNFYFFENVNTITLHQNNQNQYYIFYFMKLHYNPFLEKNSPPPKC